MSSGAGWRRGARPVLAVALALLLILAGAEGASAQEGTDGEATPPPVQLSSRRVALHFVLGTPGGGMLLEYPVHPRLGARGGLLAHPRAVSLEFGEVRYTARLPTPTLLLALDLHPPLPGVRLSAGALIPRNPLQLTTGRAGLPSGVRELVVGGEVFPANRIRELEATAVGRKVLPWVGVGWDRSRTGSRAHLSVDLGVAHWGAPVVTLTGKGPERANPAFQAALERDRLRMEEELARHAFTPVLTVGVGLPLTSR